MTNNQTMMGFVAALLLVAVILLAVDLNQQRHHTVGDSLHEAVQEMKN